MIDNGLITEEIKEKVLKQLLPIAAKGDFIWVNGDMKDRAQLSIHN